MANQYTIYQVLPEMYPHLVQIQNGTLYDGDGNLITEISGAGNGAQGPQGAGGVPSILNSTFSSVNIITITHSFGYYPVVQVLDQSYNLVTSFTVSHNSINDYTITFATSSSGLIITGAGTEGVQGTTGVQGFQGPQGITGFQGITGPQGVQGTQGSLGGGTGNQGDTGPQGYTGPQGPLGGGTGNQGETGPQGFQGYTGPQGFQGESGPQGFQGGTGPQGSNGISVSYYKYNARANSQTPPPNNSQIMWNNATQISSTIIYVSHLTRDGVDIDVFLALIKTNDSLILQDENNSNNYQKWTVNNTPTIIPNNYVSIPVTYIEGGYSFANGHDMIFVPLSIGIEGPQGFTGPQGLEGTQGFQGDFGPQGLEGPQGFQGPSGPQGTNGTIGVNGSTGAQGPIGATGANNPATNLFLFYNY